MLTARIAGALAALAVCAGLGGCGSTASTGNTPDRATTSAGPATTTSGSPPGGLPRSQLLAKASAICGAAQAKAAAEVPRLAPGQKLTAADVAKVIPISEQQARDFRALAPASDVAGDWRTFLSAEANELAYLERLAKQEVTNQPIVAAETKRLLMLTKTLTDEMARIGLVCAAAAG